MCLPCWGEEPGAEQKWGGLGGMQMGAREVWGHAGHWGSGGGKGVSNFCVVAREETEGVTGEAKVN